MWAFSCINTASVRRWNTRAHVPGASLWAGWLTAVGGPIRYATLSRPVMRTRFLYVNAHVTPLEREANGHIPYAHRALTPVPAKIPTDLIRNAVCCCLYIVAVDDHLSIIVYCSVCSSFVKWLRSNVSGFSLTLDLVQISTVFSKPRLYDPSLNFLMARTIIDWDCSSSTP